MTNKTITSKIHVLGLNPSSLYSDIYKIFYNVLKRNVCVGTKRVWFSAFPDIDIDNKDDYPFFIIDSPSLEDSKFTQIREKINTSIDIEVSTTSSRTRDEYASDILYQLKLNKHYLRKLGITKLKLVGDDSSMIMRDEIKIHTKSLSYTFEFVQTKVSPSW